MEKVKEKVKKKQNNMLLMMHIKNKLGDKHVFKKYKSQWI